jgi:two-component system phosphate regulon response regulator PhoB
MNMRHILIVEDNAAIATMLRMVLEQQGYTVSTSRHGQEGLAVLNKTDHKPDAIISNWLMPVMDGLTFLENVRHDPRWLTIPFVMLTALTSEERRVTALNHGADAFIVKPFRWSDLNGALQQLGVVPN